MNNILRYMALSIHYFRKGILQLEHYYVSKLIKINTRSCLYEK